MRILMKIIFGEYTPMLLNIHTNTGAFKIETEVLSILFHKTI